MSWQDPVVLSIPHVVTAPEWNGQVVGNMNEVWHLMAAPGARTTNVNVTATSGAAADDIALTTGALTYKAVQTRLDLYVPKLARGTTAIVLVVYDDTTQLGQIAECNSEETIGVSVYFTPTAASHTYRIKAYVDAGTGVVYAGDGTAGAYWPATLAVYQKGSA